MLRTYIEIGCVSFSFTSSGFGELSGLNDIINGDTYKKGYKKFSIEIARLKSEVSDLSVDIKTKAQEQIKLIPKLMDIPELFNCASINQQHAILNRVFKQGLTFDDGTFRTPSLNPMFHHNYQTLNKKGLLEVEQPIGNNTQIPCCGEGGIGCVALARTPGHSHPQGGRLHPK